MLVLTTFDLDQYVYEALRAGAGGFLLKDAPPGQLAEAVRTVAAGQALLAPAVTRRLIERFLTMPPGGGRALERLTDREREVLAHVGRGRSNAEIAQALHLSEATVKTHLSRVLTKAGLRDRVAAVVFAYEQGLVKPGEARRGADRHPAADGPSGEHRDLGTGRARHRSDAKRYWAMGVSRLR